MNSPLFERQATGGVVARAGFEYQDAFLLEHLPEFLSQSAFSLAVSEVLGDIEVRYHRPDGQTYCAFYEAKRQTLSKTDFWAEIERFVEVYESAPDEYVRFYLVCGGFHKDLQPVLNKLVRLRGPAASLNRDSAIRDLAEQEIRDDFKELGQTNELANFVLRRVAFIEYDDAAAAAQFESRVTRCLPEIGDPRHSQVNQFLSKCQSLVASSFKRTVTRSMIETALVESLGSDGGIWAKSPITIRLVPEADGGIEHLTLEVGAFNGEGRGNLQPSAWEGLQRQAAIIGNFVHTATTRRRIRLSAKQRISLAVVIGHEFSATRGFKLIFDHNEGVFDTSDHTKTEQRFFEHTAGPESTGANQGVLAIGFPSPIQADVQAACFAMTLTRLPSLFLESTQPVTDIATLNTAVEEAKQALVTLRGRHQLEQTHLFIKGPSVFAIALGHRLNGVGKIQLYDWIGTEYAPTALLV